MYQQQPRSPDFGDPEKKSGNQAGHFADKYFPAKPRYPGGNASNFENVPEISALRSAHGLIQRESSQRIFPKHNLLTQLMIAEDVILPRLKHEFAFTCCLTGRSLCYEIVPGSGDWKIKRRLLRNHVEVSDNKRMLIPVR